MTVDAVVFDLDGVIVDSEPVWEEVRRAYVAARGGTWQPDTQRRLMGMSTGEWAEYLSGELGVDRSAAQVAAEVVEEMARRYAVRVPLIDDADLVVRRLAARWPLGLASSSPTRLIAAALAAADLTADPGDPVDRADRPGQARTRRLPRRRRTARGRPGPVRRRGGLLQRGPLGRRRRDAGGRGAARVVPAGPGRGGVGRRGASRCTNSPPRWWTGSAEPPPRPGRPA